MPEKDLTQDWLAAPQTVRFYRKACLEVFGNAPYIPRRRWAEFSVLEDDLRELGISPMEYSRTVMEMLRKWARNKGFAYVPMNVFCGEWAMKKFLKVHRSKTVEILPTDDKERLLYSELMAARHFIQGSLENPIRFADAVKELYSLLYIGWVECYESSKGRPITEAMEILCDEYRVDPTHIRNYSDIVDSLLCHRISMIDNSASKSCH